jgi:hypothetical protein
MGESNQQISGDITGPRTAAAAMLNQVYVHSEQLMWWSWNDKGGKLSNPFGLQCVRQWPNRIHTLDSKDFLH